jgi:hypothetical protein
VVIQGLLTDCGLSDRQTNLPANANDPLAGNDLVTAVARGCKLGDDMGITVAIPREYEKKLVVFFTTENSLHDPATIRIIAETALRNNNFELAYAAAGDGLLQRGAATARFLLLRARSLPAWEISRRDGCITAAIELARRERDMDLVDEAIELRRDLSRVPFGFSFFNNMTGEGNSSMETEKLNKILQLEKEAREYPSDMPDDFFNDFDDDDDNDDDDVSDCRNCDVKNCPDREAPYRPKALYDDDFPDFNAFLDGFLPDFPPGLMALIRKVFSKHGKNGSFPDPEELSRKDPWLADQLLREMREAETEGTLPDFGRYWFPGWGSRNSRHNRR